MNHKTEIQNNTKNTTYHDKLLNLMDLYVHEVYRLSRRFPKEEMFGSVSQIRRSSLSVVLNYIEGYARQKDKVHRNFIEISYGSLKESKYLIGFAQKEGYINIEECGKVEKIADEIAKMLWGMIKNMK